MTQKSGGDQFIPREEIQSEDEGEKEETMEEVDSGDGGTPGDNPSPPLLDSAEEALNVFPLYRDRPEWADFIIPRYATTEEDENAVVSITASEKFVDAFVYLRAAFASGEHSERTFALSADCLRLNPANYTAWRFRRDCLAALGKDLGAELAGFSAEAIRESPKNYQVWHHRQILLKKAVEGNNHLPSNPLILLKGELEFVNEMLSEDAKNYHAWQFRHWLVERFGATSSVLSNFVSLLDGEWSFVRGLLTKDVCNNSAWNYRYFLLLQEMEMGEGDEKKQLLKREIIFTLEAILEAPGNESSWNYLQGILQLGEEERPLNACPEVMAFCERLVSLEPPCQSPHLYNFLVDCALERLEAEVKNVGDENSRREKIQTEVGQAKKWLVLLEKLDPVRANFWQYRRNCLDRFIFPSQ